MESSSLPVTNARFHLIQYATPETVSVKAKHAETPSTFIKQDSQPPCSSTTNSRVTLMSLPNEILRMILKFLLLSARSVQIPTLGSLSSGYRAKLSAQVLRTCQRMYLQGRQLLYTHNIFNVEHYIFPFMSEYHSQCRRDGHCACDIRTYCPIPPSYLAMIKHFEIDMVKPEYYQARIEHNRVSVIVRRALAVLSHLPDLDSIRIIIEGRYEQNKSFIGSRLGMPAEYGPYLRRHIWSGGQDGWAAAKVAEDNYEADWIIVQYCAILLAQTFRQHAPQYQYMYLALRPSGGESINKRLELNLIMHRSRGDIRSYTMHKQRGFIYICQLEVDPERGRVKRMPRVGRA